MGGTPLSFPLDFFISIRLWQIVRSLFFQNYSKLISKTLAQKKILCYNFKRKCVNVGIFGFLIKALILTPERGSIDQKEVEYMKKYEVLYILAGNLDEETKESFVTRFENLVTEAGGEATVNKWGMRKLAYEVNFKTEGYYVLMEFTAGPELPKEMERQMGLAKDEILRFMITSLD